ncbi:hypothetical protein [Hydrogenoanaerobacterium sp.]|uniref:hypothetical protein n=1 Tax=Hydrogenoanaerobacterium sp. TaxID=2953763 RepID=UPI0028A08AE7|nr:hypothetical protein [Hydrogenoanaerobacterium sp.]
MLKKSSQVALGGMIAALCVLLMLMTGILPFLSYAVPAMAGFLMVVMVIECGTKWAVLVYIAVSILSLLIAPDKTAAFIFVFFLGFYPILKGTLEKLKSRILEWSTKMILFNVCIVAAYLLMIYVLKMPEVMTEMGEFGKYTGVITLALGNFVFVVFDISLTRIISAYILWFRPKFLRRFG